jgi:O-antigen/teichoic acid export membrane protein
MLIRHSMTYVAAKVLPGMLGMVTTAILTRILTPTEYGLYGLSLVIMGFGVNMGFDWLFMCLTRFYEAQRRDPKVIGTVMRIFSVNVLLSAALFLLFWQLNLLPGPETPSYAMGLVLMWSTGWFEFVACIEIVNLRPLVYFSMNSVRAVCVLVFAAAAAWLTRDPIWTGAGTALGVFVGSFLRRSSIPWRGPRSFDAGLAREMIAFGLPLAGAMIMGSMNYTGTRVMVEWLGSAAELGYYTAAFVLIQNTLVVVASGIASASYPLAVRAVETGDPEIARRQLLDNATLLLAVMAPASLGAALTAQGIAITLVGAQYADAVASLTPWMAAGSFFMSMRGNYLDYAFQLGRRPLLQFRVLSVCAVVSLVLAYWLIPRLGPEGAAIAVTVALAGACVHARIEGIASGFVLPLPIAAAGKILLACGVMSLGVLSIRGDTPTHFVLQIIVGGLVYSFSVVALNVFGLRDQALNHVRPWLLRSTR